MDKTTTLTTLTCDNCDDSGSFIGRGGYLSTYCRKTGKPVQDCHYPTCSKHSKLAVLEKGGLQ